MKKIPAPVANAASLTPGPGVSPATRANTSSAVARWLSAEHGGGGWGGAGGWGLGAWAQAAKFAGTWEAAHEGKVFLVLKVEAGQRISGTLNAGSITLSDEGDLVKAEPVEDRPAPFFFAKAEGDKLEFDYQDQGDDEVMHFELKLTGEGAGELRIVDEHIPKMKPFRLRKKAPARG